MVSVVFFVGTFALLGVWISVFIGFLGPMGGEIFMFLHTAQYIVQIVVDSLLLCFARIQSKSCCIVFALFVQCALSNGCIPFFV